MIRHAICCIASENQRHARFSTVAEGNADPASIVRAVHKASETGGASPLRRADDSPRLQDGRTS